MPRLRPSTADSNATTSATTSAPLASPQSRPASIISTSTSRPVKLPQTFTDGLPLPKLMVFDLDYTLWPFWVDAHVTPPIKSQDGGKTVRDRYGEGFAFYDDVPGVLGALRQLKILVGAASRTCAPDLAREMLRLLRIPAKPPLPGSIQNSPYFTDEPTSPVLPSNASIISSATTPRDKDTARSLAFFDHLQIYPGSKIRHFEALAKDTEFGYEEMLFFDDESRNKEVEKLGVVMRLVRNGVTCDDIDQGVKEWRRRNRRV